MVRFAGYLRERHLRAVDESMLLRAGNVRLAALALVAIFASGSTGRGSILSPQLPTFDLEHLQLLSNESERTSAKTTTSSASEPVPTKTPANDSEEIDYVSGLLAPVSDATSTGASSSGPSGGGGMFCISTQATCLTGDGPVGWILRYCYLSVPDPPISELIQPPEASCGTVVDNFSFLGRQKQ